MFSRPQMIRMFLTMAATTALAGAAARLDKSEKLPVYGGHGVSYAWLVDPRLRTVDFLRFEGKRWALRASHGDARASGPSPSTR